MDGREARDGLIGQILGEMLGQVAFDQIDPAHRSDLAAACLQSLERLARGPVLTALGGTGALPGLADGIAGGLVSYAPFLALVQDDELSDVLVNGPDEVYVERAGRLEPTGVRFPSEASLQQLAGWLTTRVGRPVGPRRPMVDARMPDGSRLNVIIPPLALDGTVLSIRRFRHTGLDLAGLVAAGSLPRGIEPLLRAMVAARLNIIVSGGTGAGKTTMLNALSEGIGAHERVVTIEDSAELALRRDHVVRLETRVEDGAGLEGVDTRALVRNALRMRPDRILVGEVRGAEAIDMLQAMNSGHEGSMTTLHANSGRDALDRLEVVAGMSRLGLDPLSIRRQIGRSLDAVLQVERRPDGRRVLASILEVSGLQGQVLATQEILRFAPPREFGGRGGWLGTGVRPAFADRLQAAGEAVPAGLWQLRAPVP